jgi:L-erythro-3,5-diaminohexanoate dehydrogenase
MGFPPSDPTGRHRVVAPAGVLPQAAERLDTRRELWPDETRVRVERLNLDAASYRQLAGRHTTSEGGVDGDAVRADVLDIVARRGKMQNPVTGSGGMLLGTVEETGPASPLGLRPGDRVATLVSLTLTPLVLADGLARWDGLSEQVPADGYAVLFGRSVAARLPADLPDALALAVLDVCGAPALTARVVQGYADPAVVVLGGGGKSGSLALAAARRAGATTAGVVPTEEEADRLRAAGLAQHVLVADARDALATRDAVVAGLGRPADVTVVCVDVSGCEGGAVLATADRGTVVFFSMATSFSGAALSAEGLAADVTLLIGNGYVPGHADYALSLLREEPGLRALFEERLHG